MRRYPLRTTSATLSYSNVAANRLTKLGCRRCRTTLDIIQPRVEQPDQFLAICPGCGAWFRIETRPGEVDGVILSLPEAPTMGPGAEPVPAPTT